MPIELKRSNNTELTKVSNRTSLDQESISDAFERAETERFWTGTTSETRPLFLATRTSPIPNSRAEGRDRLIENVWKTVQSPGQESSIDPSPINLPIALEYAVRNGNLEVVREIPITEYLEELAQKELNS